MPPKKAQKEADMDVEEKKTATKKADGAEKTKGKKSKKPDASELGSTGDLPQLDDFVDGLCTWKSALESTTKQKYFTDLYKFLKTEYSTKTVRIHFIMAYNL